MINSSTITTNRVIKNTGILYLKMGITMFISLYTTRLILKTLGAEDFGIFNIVGGAIAMLGFLNAAMASATQRFISFSQGEGNKNKQKKIFNISFILHLGIAFLVGFLLLFVGYFLFNSILNIASERMFAAKVVYASLIVSTVFTVMTVPYDAVLNAHENMLYYSIVGVVESLLKLGVAFAVVYVASDKLVLYGILMAIIPLITLTIMRIYCHNHYEECVIAPRQYWDNKLFIEITRFAGWSFIGVSSAIISQYGLSIVLNHFWGVLLNTAQGIGNQITGQIQAFSSNMVKAVNPLISKYEGAGNRDLMLNISLITCKYSFYILSFFAIPFILEADYILNLWLTDVPEWAVLFTRLQLIRSLIEQITISLSNSIAAQGDIKLFSIISSFLSFSPIIFTYLFFYFNYPPYFMYIIWIFIGGVVGGFLRIYFLKLKCDLNFIAFYNVVLKYCIIISLTLIISGFLPMYFIESSFLRLLFVIISTSISGIFINWFYLLSNDEKLLIKNILSTLKLKIKFKN